jgi:hypothetical protein
MKSKILFILLAILLVIPASLAMNVTSIVPSSCPSRFGGLMKINGDGFVNSSVNNVTFNNTEVVATFVNSTYMTAPIPPSQSDGVINVTINNDNNIVKLDNSFTYYKMIIPRVTNITPKYGNAGSSVSITGTDLDAITNASFGGVPTIFTIVSPTELTVIAPAHANGLVDVEIDTDRSRIVWMEVFNYQ